MCRILILSALFVVVFSCSPTKTAPRAPATTTPTSTTTMTAVGGRRRRSAEYEVTVTVVTKKKFEDSTKDLHYEMVKMIVEDSGNALLKEGKVQKTFSQGGKLAVEYKVHGFCEDVKEDTKGLKEHGSVVDYVIVKCKK